MTGEVWEGPIPGTKLAQWAGVEPELSWGEAGILDLFRWRAQMDAEAEAFMRGEIDLPLTAEQELEAAL